ncbi:hypothetical protein GCM10020331_031750 [Ectobacillus funiculus]
MSITPIAFLVVNGKGIKVLHLDENTHLLDKVIDMAPQAVEKNTGYAQEKANKRRIKRILISTKG